MASSDKAAKLGLDSAQHSIEQMLLGLGAIARCD